MFGTLPNLRWDIWVPRDCGVFGVVIDPFVELCVIEFGVIEITAAMRAGLGHL